MTRPTPADRRTARAQTRGKRTGRAVTSRQRRSALARNFTQDEATGRLSGSGSTPAKAHPLRYSLRKCPWCRGVGQRPIYTGTGATKSVRGFTRCTHMWSAPNGGPGQKGLERGDRLWCGSCESKGFYTVAVTVKQPRMTVVQPFCCRVCAGWVVAWNTRRGPQRKRAMRKLRAALAGEGRLA